MDENGEVYKCKVKPRQSSDKFILEILLNRLYIIYLFNYKKYASILYIYSCYNISPKIYNSKKP